MRFDPADIADLPGMPGVHGSLETSLGIVDGMVGFVIGVAIVVFETHPTKP